MVSKHDKTAKRLAKKIGTGYNRGQGPDINAENCATEVETANTAKDGLRQPQSFRKPVFIAGTDAKATEAALKKTQGTTVGVMDSQGNIKKNTTCGRK